MTLAELLKALVECDDQMERMALVEANAELMVTKEEGEGEGEGGEQEENVCQGCVEKDGQLTELKQKYIDTFFSGSSGSDETQEEDQLDEEAIRAETIKTDDLFKEE